MFRILALCALLGAAVAQSQSQNQYNRDPQTAAILTEQRYQSGDGKFGNQYTQEDGVEFKEESDADGTRHGSYSYLDPTGQRRTVSYTAGKNGFQATGDHLPQAPAAQAPQNNYTPLPQYQSPEYQQPQQQYQQQQPQYQQQQPQYQPQPQYKPQPQPQYKPQPQYQQQQPAYQQYQQTQTQQPQYQQQAQQYQPQPQQYQATTQSPHRFYPPGKLSLERSPDGFSYSFQKS